MSVMFVQRKTRFAAYLLCVLLLILVGPTEPFIVNENSNVTRPVELGPSGRPIISLLWLFVLDGSPHAWGKLPIGRLAVADINANRNILPDYELVAIERPASYSRLDFDVKRTLGRLVQAVYDEPTQYYMVIGPTYTAEATAVSQLAPNFNLINVAGLATSPVLSDKKVYPLIFRTSMSAGDFKYSLLSLLKKFDYERVIGLYMNDPFALDTAPVLERYLEQNGVHYETKTIFSLQDNGSPVANLMQSTTSRIVLVIANANEARHVFCQVILGEVGQNFTNDDGFQSRRYANYLWLFLGITTASRDFEIPRPTVDKFKCTLQQTQRELNGSFWFDYGGLDPDDRPMLTGYRPSELRQRVNNYIDLNYPNLTAAEKTVPEPSYREYDSFLAAAVALNLTATLFKSQNYTTRLEKFTYSRADIGRAMKDSMLKVDVQGAAGRLSFQANGDRPPTVSLFQYQPGAGGKKISWFPVGHAAQVQQNSSLIQSDNTPSVAAYELVFTKAILFGTVDGQNPSGLRDAISTGFFDSKTNVTLIIVAVLVIAVLLSVILIGVYVYNRRSARLAAVSVDLAWLLDPAKLELLSFVNKSGTMSSLGNVSSMNMHSIFLDTVSADTTNNNGLKFDIQRHENLFRIAKYNNTQLVSLFHLAGFGTNGGSASCAWTANESTGSVHRRPHSATQRNGFGSDRNGKSYAHSVKFLAEQVLTIVNLSAHDNVARFIGVALVEPPHTAPADHDHHKFDENYVAYEWHMNNKGSLRDTLLDEGKINMDKSFKFSLWMDVALGLAHLHRFVSFHGRLKSTNILISNHFSCKLADYGLSKTQGEQLLTAARSEKSEYSQRLLWAAPELLQILLDVANQAAGDIVHEGMSSLDKVDFMRKADTFSLSVVVYEILTRNPPYEHSGSDDDEYHELCPTREKQILERIVQHHNLGESLLHTTFFNSNEGQVAATTISAEACQLFSRCCSVSPSERPSPQAIVDELKRTMRQQGMSDNIMENLLYRVEQYAQNLEVLVQDKTQAFFDEKKRAEALLYNILPPTVADQLKNGQPVEPESYDCVSIYFSDLVGFTSLSAESTPIQVIDLLNDLYNMFDTIIADYDVYKVETIGDAYMVVSGLPRRNGIEHARQIARMSQQLVRDVSRQFRVRHKPADYRLRLRVGLHAGPCAAGVVGFKMPRYCLFGDTVNTASRMESTGEPMRIHISKDMRDLLKVFSDGDTEEFACELRGETAVKGKGMLHTYWLLYAN